MKTLAIHTQHPSPATRGALFYLLFWGSAGVYVPFLSVYFANFGIANPRIGLLMGLVPLITLTISDDIAPPFLRG